MHHPTSTLFQLVQHLNHGAFQDGETLGQSLGVSRAAIWKTISKLEQYGVPLKRVKKKGYQLEHPLSLLDPLRLQSELASMLDLKYFETIDSTQTAIKKLTDANTRPLLYVSEQQTQGRGRLNRTWHAPFGQHLYLTLRYPFQQDLSELTGLSLMVSLSMATASQSFLPDTTRLQVKWPNDLVYQTQKLGGCLIEVQAEAHGSCTAWIGIGLNVNAEENSSQPQIAQAIPTPWTALSKLTGHRLDRTQVLIHLIKTLLGDLQVFSTQGFSGFLDHWKELDSLQGQTVSIQPTLQLPPRTGIARGVNALGHLQFQLASGEVISCANGDVRKNT